MIDWKPEAVVAALTEMFSMPADSARYMPFADRMIAALDAAVEAQESLVDIGEDLNHTRSYKRGRAEALKEAADLAHERSLGFHFTAENLAKAKCARDIAIAIRALAKEPPRPRDADLEAQLASTKARASEYAKRIDELEKALERMSNLVRELWEITP